MPYIATTGGLNFYYPVDGTQNWGVTMRTTWNLISAHDHTGGGNGVQISANAIASNAITDAKIRLSNNTYLRGRNAANSADINIVAVNASNTLTLGTTLESPAINSPTITGTLSLSTPLDVTSGGTGGSSAAAARTALGLGTVATQAASGVAITGGTATGLTSLGAAAASITGTLALTGAASVTAAGSNQGTAAALSSTISLVGGADGTKGVVLPVPISGVPVGTIMVVINQSSSILKLYPSSGASMGGLSANASTNIASNSSAVVFVNSGSQFGVILGATL